MAATTYWAKAIWVVKYRNTMVRAMQRLADSKERVIIATGRYIGEGFDDSRLDTLFLAMPISWQGTLQQYVGRLHRIHDGKTVVQVYDYVDRNVPVLLKMSEKRLKKCPAIGYRVEKIGEIENADKASV